MNQRNIDTYLFGLMMLHLYTTKLMGLNKRAGNVYHYHRCRKVAIELEEEMMQYIPKNILKQQLWPD